MFESHFKSHNRLFFNQDVSKKKDIERKEKEEQKNAGTLAEK